MPDLPCDWCHAEPASHLIVYDVGHRDCRAPTRVKAMIGDDCRGRNPGRALRIASIRSFWLFTLTPAKETVDA